MKNRRKIMMVLFWCILCCSCGDQPSYKELVFQQVKENESDYREALEADIGAELPGIEAFRSSAEQESAEFVCGGFGFPDGTVYGFYYVADDEPLPGHIIGGGDLEEYKDGYISYFYADYDGDGESAVYGHYYTEKICDNFWFWSETD